MRKQRCQIPLGKIICGNFGKYTVRLTDSYHFVDIYLGVVFRYPENVQARKGGWQRLDLAAQYGSSTSTVFFRRSIPATHALSS
jgi:hypothetical protein